MSAAAANQGAASRKFKLGLGVRSFQAGRRLSVNLASVFVQVKLPVGLVDIICNSGGSIPEGTNPFRTHPAVDVARGSEAILPGGQISLEFNAGLMHLAATLAHEPRLVAEVWHKEKFQQSSLLGVASIPLSPLLQESWVQGTAPVLAQMAKADQRTQESMQVGSLRMVLSLEELGPASVAATHQGPDDTATAAAKAGAQPVADLSNGQSLTNDQSKPSFVGRSEGQVGASGARGIAGGNMADASKAAPGHPPESVFAAQAAAPLAAAPEQALKAEISEAASEPELLFAPDFIISQVEQFTNALQRQSVREDEAGDEDVPGLPEAAEDLADEMAVAALSRTISMREESPSGGADLQRNSSGLQRNSSNLRRQSSQLRRPSFGRASSDNSPSRAEARAVPESAGLNRGSPQPQAQPQPQEEELQAAWELEVWKNAEEVKWRAELRERELERMSMLEREWRRREASRTAEVAHLKSHYESLDSQTRQILDSAEERERKLIALEEEMARRRRDLEHDHTSRIAEAEATVRRLQADFEHQVKLERQHNAELVRQQEQVRQAEAAARAESSAVEQEFRAYRAAQHSSPEADLARQLADAQEQARRAEAKAQKAQAAKHSYKEQVLKLAQDLGSLQRQMAHDQAAQVAQQKAQLDEAAVRLAHHEAAVRASSQRSQLASLRAQLNALQQAPPSGPAQAPPAAPAPAPGKEASAEAVTHLAEAGTQHQQAQDRGAVTAKPAAQMEHVEEAKRLLQERSSLLKTGSYTKDSPVIQQLDARIQELGNKALGTWAPST